MIKPKLEHLGARRAIGLEPVLPAALRRAFAWCLACAERRRQRRFLATLDDRARRDIGLARGEAAGDLGEARTLLDARTRLPF